MFRVGKSGKTEPAEQPRQQPQPRPAQPPAGQTAPERGEPSDLQAARPVGVPAPAGCDDTAERSTPLQRPQGAQQQPEAAGRGAVSETDALARGIKDGGVGGFVGGTSELTGEVRFRGMMRVDGHLSGSVISEDGTLIVSSGGHVSAEVSVAVAKINGTVTGNVTASEKIELGRTAHVTGDLQTPALVVEQGAIFEGGCRMKTATGARDARSKNAA